ncbi:YihY/virulence factor BrkB family protein [Actinoplanes sp. NPDC023714]|uniref:YihY/virulence factor BrkB family protein n=1 Tax=Actinoplanes sp. NPDC023714 TaxID=3154322 RepID=UPI0033D406D6
MRRLDAFQQRHRTLGFTWAVIQKYLDDRGPREAALITYYGFLSLFPLLLLGVAIVTQVLARRPDLREEVVTAMVPPTLQDTIESGIATMSGSATALLVGVIGLIFSATGVVFSAYETLNHLAGVPFADRPMVGRYLRVLGGLLVILAGSLTIGALTVAMAALPGALQYGAVLGSALVTFLVLMLVAWLLLARRTRASELWLAAAIGAVAVTAVLNLGAAVLPELVRRAGRVYGAFATVAGAFTLFYLLSNALVLAAEIAVVRHARLWPRALDQSRPAPADLRARARLAREQERAPGDRITYTHEPGEPEDQPEARPG